MAPEVLGVKNPLQISTFRCLGGAGTTAAAGGADGDQPWSNGLSPGSSGSTFCRREAASTAAAVVSAGRQNEETPGVATPGDPRDVPVGKDGSSIRGRPNAVKVGSER
jgi:hypothetical protein